LRRRNTYAALPLVAAIMERRGIAAIGDAIRA